MFLPFKGARSATKDPASDNGQKDSSATPRNDGKEIMTGFINIYKEKGVGSTFVVNRIKRLTKTSAGHMGTLDPLASGVLPVASGNAARLFDYFLRKEKTYLARFRFGITTDTLDEEGEKISGGRVPGEAEINAALPAFFGEIEQVPPKYSAVSVGGRRGYELARAGADFNLQAKKVRILSFECTGQTAPDEYAFEIVCGGGTYIRSLARDLAVALGTQGYMSALERTASGVFTKEGAVTLNELTPENIAEHLVPTESVLPYPVLEGADARIFNGVAVECTLADGLYKLYREREFYGLARVVNGYAKAEKKLC